MEEKGNHFKMQGLVVVCGDFNARFGGLSDRDGESSRCVDMEKNGQGELRVNS